jgi:hypothetical protein
MQDKPVALVTGANQGIGLQNIYQFLLQLLGSRLIGMWI